MQDALKMLWPYERKTQIYYPRYNIHPKISSSYLTKMCVKSDSCFVNQ